jgi:hypothetical protein
MEPVRPAVRGRGSGARRGDRGAPANVRLRCRASWSRVLGRRVRSEHRRPISVVPGSRTFRHLDAAAVVLGAAASGPAGASSNHRCPATPAGRSTRGWEPPALASLSRTNPTPRPIRASRDRPVVDALEEVAPPVSRPLRLAGSADGVLRRQVQSRPSRKTRRSPVGEAWPFRGSACPPAAPTRDPARGGRPAAGARAAVRADRPGRRAHGRAAVARDARGGDPERATGRDGGSGPARQRLKGRSRRRVSSASRGPARRQCPGRGANVGGSPP